MTDYWIVIGKDSNQHVWEGTWRNRLLRRFPKVTSEGLVFLDQESPYVVDPKRFVRERKSRRFLPFSKYDVYQYWLQDEPDPISFENSRCTLSHDHCPGRQLTPGTYTTSNRMKAFAKAKHIEMVLTEGTNWVAIIAVLAILGLIGAMVALYFRR